MRPVLNLANRNPADRAEIHLTFTDPALNIDPTTADVWTFDLSDNDGDTTTVIFANNATSSATNTALNATDLGILGCNDNCALSSDGEAVLGTGANTVSAVDMTESGANTGVFESFDINGAAQFETIAEAAADTNTVFSYGGNSVDMIITYNDASISLDAGGDWSPGQSATISVNDPDQNRNPTSAETLAVADETAVIPTIKVGTGGLTLAEGTNLSSGAGGSCTSFVCTGVVVGDDDSGAANYGVNVYNTTDNSERLRIIHSSETGTMGTATSTWINVTTGHTIANLVNLPGTVVLSYDVSAPADLVSSTDINVFVVGNGNNSTDSKADSIDAQTSGNVKSGVVDLDGGSGYGNIISRDITANADFGISAGADDTALAATLVTVAFQLTHAVGSDMASNADYAIYADFCNFDQNNGSLTHNCMYRLEAVETGDNTGIFEGTVEYINMTNSTTGGSVSGEHAGNDHNVEGLLGYVKGDALSVVLMDSVSGSDSVRVVYNDTDAFQVATKIGAQLETSTHTGDISLDADSYGPDDIATITIVDADLNTDSAIRDTYENSSTTFKMTVTASGTTTAQQPFSAKMTLIETGDNTGVFVGTFKVPDFKGADMELVYYESKDAGGSAVEYYDTATITSNSGSIAFDRSVYPVPWTANDLSTGDATTTTATQTEAGSVTAWITVSDVDETNDTLTTGTSSAAGTDFDQTHQLYRLCNGSHSR